MTKQSDSAPSLDAKELKRISALLRAMNFQKDGFGFLPPGGLDDEHSLILTVWEGDLLLGRIVFSDGFFLFYPGEQPDINDADKLFDTHQTKHGPLPVPNSFTGPKEIPESVCDAC